PSPARMPGSALPGDSPLVPGFFFPGNTSVERAVAFDEHHALAEAPARRQRLLENPHRAVLHAQRVLVDPQRLRLAGERRELALRLDPAAVLAARHVRPGEKER